MQDIGQSITRYLGKEAGRFAGKCIDEISGVADLLKSGNLLSNGYNVHKVNLGGSEAWAVDARSLNRAYNSSGRGNYRWILGMNCRPLAIATHKAGGDYKVESRL